MLKEDTTRGNSTITIAHYYLPDVLYLHKRKFFLN